MTGETHYRGLERLYLAAPINTIYRPDVRISEGIATVEITLGENLHHPAGAAHGSVYFKMMDDAAFFAANSLETEVFLLTTTFTTYLTRPVSGGKMRAEGRVVNRNRSQFIAEAVVYNDNDQEVGRGNGLFVRSRIALADLADYRGAES
jgi:uncharacterized protein (TIGR00369 family)